MYLYDDDHIRVVFDDRGGNTLLVTFNEMEFPLSGRSYWSEKPAANLGLSCIGMVSKSKNWFPHESMTEACKIVKSIARNFEKVINYGFSQGAYGAIKYSALLGSTHSLAFSPQWSIEPSLVEIFDRRFLKHYDPIYHNGMAISENDVEGQVLLIFDPHQPEDAVHASKINQVSDNVKLVRCNFIGHGTVRAVSSSESLNALVELCNEGRVDEKDLFKVVTSSKKKTFAYFYFMGRTALKRGHVKWAEDFYWRSHKINEKHPYLSGWKSDLDRAKALL